MDYYNWSYGAESGQDGRTYNSIESFVKTRNLQANEEKHANDEVTNNGKKIEPLPGADEGNETKVKIVAFTDHTFAGVAKWWYQRMTDLSYTTHTLVLIDETAVEHFTSINMDFNATRNKNHDRIHEQEQMNNRDQRCYRFESHILDEGT
jgi:hypothetical protein